MKALLFIALCIISVSSTQIFLKAPAKKVSDSSSPVIWQNISLILLQVNNDIANYTVQSINITDGVAKAVFLVQNQTVNSSNDLSVDLNVFYGFPWSNQMDITEANVSIKAANVSTTNITNLTVSSPVINATLSFTQTQSPKENTTTLGTITLFMNVTSEPDSNLQVTLTNLNFTRTWGTIAPINLTTSLSVNNTKNQTLNTTGVLYDFDLADMTAQVMLNLTSVNITWVNGSTSAPSIPLVFNATYNFPGTDFPMASPSQQVDVTLEIVNAKSNTWDNKTNLSSIVITTPNPQFVQNVTLVVEKTWDSVSNVTVYQLQSFNLSGIKPSASINETDLRPKLIATNITAVVTGPKSQSTSIQFQGANDAYSYAFPNNTNGKGAIVLQGTRSTSQSLYIVYTVTETYNITSSNTTSNNTWTFNQTIADYIGNFTQNSYGTNSSVAQLFNVSNNQSGQNDWFNVSYAITNYTNGSQPYFSGWKFNLQNLTVNFDFADGENVKSSVLTSVPYFFGSQTTQAGNALDSFNSVCSQNLTSGQSICTLTPITGSQVALPIPNIDNNVTLGSENITVTANNLNVTYMYQPDATLQPQTQNFSINPAIYLNTSSCFSLTNPTGLFYSVNVCGTKDFNKTVVNQTVYFITSMTFTFNTYVNYKLVRANLTQLQLLTTGLSVQQKTLSTSNNSTNTSGVSLGLPTQQYLVSNQTTDSNLNLSLQYNVSQVYTYITVSLKDSKDNNTNSTSTYNVSIPFNYTEGVLQNIMEVELPSGPQQSFMTTIASPLVQWSNIKNTPYGYGAGNLTVQLGWSAQDFQEMTAPSSGLSGGAIAGIVIGCIAFIAILGIVIYCVTKKKDQDFYTKQNA